MSLTFLGAGDAHHREVGATAKAGYVYLVMDEFRHAGVAAGAFRSCWRDGRGEYGFAAIRTAQTQPYVATLGADPDVARRRSKPGVLPLHVWHRSAASAGQAMFRR